MIETDIRSTITGNAAISAIISTRMFLREPLREQNQPYLIYQRQTKSRDMVSEINRFQIVAFSADQVQLEELCGLIINLLEDKKTFNGNFYYSVSLQNQSDGSERLANGMYWSLMTFEFKSTT